MMTVIPFVSNRPFIRLRAVRPMLEEFMKAAINECALAVHVLPEDILADRDQLTACLTEQLRDLGHRKAAELEARWQSEWEKLMAAHLFVDLPNIQN
jgi:hypothetical protein